MQSVLTSLCDELSNACIVLKQPFVFIRSGYTVDLVNCIFNYYAGKTFTVKLNAKMKNFSEESLTDMKWTIEAHLMESRNSIYHG